MSSPYSALPLILTAFNPPVLLCSAMVVSRVLVLVLVRVLVLVLVRACVHLFKPAEQYEDDFVLFA